MPAFTAQTDILPRSTWRPRFALRQSWLRSTPVSRWRMKLPKEKCAVQLISRRPHRALFVEAVIEGGQHLGGQNKDTVSISLRRGRSSSGARRNSARQHLSLMSVMACISDLSQTSLDVCLGPMLLKKVFRRVNRFFKKHRCGGPKMTYGGHNQSIFNQRAQAKLSVGSFLPFSTASTRFCRTKCPMSLPL
jgi:hypothetical protein